MQLQHYNLRINYYLQWWENQHSLGWSIQLLGLGFTFFTILLVCRIKWKYTKLQFINTSQFMPSLSICVFIHFMQLNLNKLISLRGWGKKNPSKSSIWSLFGVFSKRKKERNKEMDLEMACVHCPYLRNMETKFQTEVYFLHLDIKSIMQCAPFLFSKLRSPIKEQKIHPISFSPLLCSSPSLVIGCLLSLKWSLTPVPKSWAAHSFKQFPLPALVSHRQMKQRVGSLSLHVFVELKRLRTKTIKCKWNKINCISLPLLMEFWLL